jgi:ribosomal-protein-alanine N-acetyltransferase
MNAPESFLTDRLIIRRLKTMDAESIFNAYASNVESVKYISWKVHETLIDTKAFLEVTIPKFDSGKDYAYGIELKDSKEFIGSIGMVNEGGKAFIGYIIGAKYEGKGYCTEAAKCILNHLSKQPDIFRIWACCAVENIGSVKVLEKAGMVQEATIKDWVLFPNLNNEPRDCHFYYYPS